MKESLSPKKSVILLLLIALIVSSLFFSACRKKEAPSQASPPLGFSPKVKEDSAKEPSDDTLLHIPHYPEGLIGIDPLRRSYADGSMILAIPRLNYQGPVLEGMPPAMKEGADIVGAMEESVLEDGVVLFNQSQLPGVENRNVSIAGHRDIHGQEFYYIDTITQGDLLYLYYQQKEYTYAYQSTNITDPYDWGYIANTSFSTLTLQSCDPIGVASERMFVSAQLTSVRDLSPAETEALATELPSFTQN